MLKAQFPMLDKNKDGALDESELGAVMAMMMRQMADKGPTSGL
jgi:Ca2+-binding EF-hand superfamily protein